MKSIVAVLFGTAITCMPGCSTVMISAGHSVSPPSEQASRLVNLMAERLRIAEEVAWAKYVDQIPVRDSAREKALIADRISQWQEPGLSPTQIRSFFEAQIKASRMLQARSIARWEHGDTLPALPPQGLKRDLRPRLDTVDRELLKQLSLVSRSPALATFAERELISQGFPAGVVRAACAPLRTH